MALRICFFLGVEADKTGDRPVNCLCMTSRPTFHYVPTAAAHRSTTSRINLAHTQITNINDRVTQLDSRASIQRDWLARTLRDEVFAIVEFLVIIDNT